MSYVPALHTPVRRRNPFVVWLILPVFTFGIYGLYWYYVIHSEMAQQRRDPSAPVAGPLLVMLFLSWTVIAPLVSIYNTGTRIRRTQQAAGLVPTCSGGLGLVLAFVLGLWVAYYQSELNKIPDTARYAIGPVYRGAQLPPPVVYGHEHNAYGTQRYYGGYHH